jgi:putative hydrolase of the HAD superfamily
VIRTILFDLDDTLYPPSLGVLDHIRGLILRYIETHLDLPPGEADALRRRYFEAYGTTMRGLQIRHRIDADEFLRYVHDIPLREYLQPNPDLDSVLASIPQDKVIFTNASREHAERVLAVLGVEHHFSRIIDVRDMAYESKPQPAAYQRICEMLSVRPEECMLVEDNPRNLQPAKEIGMVTVLVHDGDVAAQAGVDHVIRRIEEIDTVLGLRRA